MGKKESTTDTARVLGRMYGGTEGRGFAQDTVETLEQHVGNAVCNGLTDEWCPTQMLAGMLTMRERSTKHFDAIAYCYLGDAWDNTACSLLVTGALGMNVHIADRPLWPDEELRATAATIAEDAGAHVLVADVVADGVRGVEYRYTDVWVAMGEPAEIWDARIAELLPYQVNAHVVALTGIPRVSFMACLPAFQNCDTPVGAEMFERSGLSALGVTEDVFEPPRSVVFDRAETRLDTIEAVMVATLGV